MFLKISKIKFFNLKNDEMYMIESKKKGLILTNIRTQ